VLKFYFAGIIYEKREGFRIRIPTLMKSKFITYLPLLAIFGMVFGPSLEELFTLNEVVEHCRLSLFELGQLRKI
jgi:hypothetical protein